MLIYILLVSWFPRVLPLFGVGGTSGLLLAWSVLGRLNAKQTYHCAINLSICYQWPPILPPLFKIFYNLVPSSLDNFIFCFYQQMSTYFHQVCLIGNKESSMYIFDPHPSLKLCTQLWMPPFPFLLPNQLIAYILTTGPLANNSSSSGPPEQLLPRWDILVFLCASVTV